LDPKEYEARLVAIEQMVETLVRGYRRGNHFQILGGLEKTAQEHDRLYDGSDGDGDDQYLDANARGYRNGRRGTKDEGPS
jgi:hypothetical protein